LNLLLLLLVASGLAHLELLVPLALKHLLLGLFLQVFLAGTLQC
jgi:hypothetical protein